MPTPTPHEAPKSAADAVRAAGTNSVDLETVRAQIAATLVERDGVTTQAQWADVNARLHNLYCAEYDLKQVTA